MNATFINPGNFFSKALFRMANVFLKPKIGLLSELIRANYKSQNQSTVLGISWSLIAPAAMFLAMYTIFNLHFGKKVFAYPLYLLLGIILVNFFATVIMSMSQSLYTQPHLVLNSTVPREYLVLSFFSVHARKFIIEILISWIISVIYGVFNMQYFLLFVPVILSFCAFTIGVGFMVAILYCFMRDFEHIWTLVSRLLFFISPIFYTLEGIRPLAREAVYWLNPLTPFMVTGRQLFIATGSIDFLVYAHCIVLGLSVFFLGYAVLIIFEKTAVEKI